MPEESFLAGVDRWIGVLGRFRDVIRQELVASQLTDALRHRGIGQGRVLDVGCGQGTQALALARRGHHVTGLDPSTELLGRFHDTLAAEPGEVQQRVRLVHGPGEHARELTPGPFQVVLCHGVLGYPAPLLHALTQVVAPGATLSLLVRNGLAPAMREGLRGNPTEALTAFDQRDYVNRLGLTAHIHTPEDLRTILNPLGWETREWYGVRVFNDHRDEPAPSRDRLDAVLAAEREAGRRDPYRHVAALLHLLFDQPHSTMVPAVG
jgi:S-adenosylmethionine-dependent methyltransferase